MTALTIEITFLSDWGVGTGAGRGGDVDKVVAKDQFGLPMVPAKSLTGMLREACEEAAFALDAGSSQGVWNDWLTWLFGDQPSQGRGVRRPVPAALSIRPATLGPVAQAIAEHDRTFAQAAVVVRPGVKIDEATGVAKDDTLRMEERALTDLRLTASATVADLPREARVLLVSGSRLLERIGGKRRRGAGRCGVRILQGTTPLGVTAEDFDDPGAPPVTSAAQWTTASDSQAPLTALTFDLTCLTPVVASAGVKGNVVESLDYIPGYLLFPLVARALGGDVSALVEHGQIRVSDATLLVGDRRHTPVPLSVQKPKGAIGKMHNAVEGDPEGDARYVPVKQGWIDPYGTLGDDVESQDLVERAHAVVDDEQQRPTEQTGGLFVQQALPAGTRLRFQVELPGDIALPLSGEHAVGRSKKDDYGLVSIQAVDASLPDLPSADSSTVIAYVESDTLLLDENLAATTSASDLTTSLEQALGIAATADPTAFLAVRRHDTWSARWGLPRPSLVAIKAGTVVAFTADKTVASGVITIGERQAEGFGRVWINPPVLVGTGTSGALEPTHSQSGRESGEDHNVRIIRGNQARIGLLQAVNGVDAAELCETLGLTALTNSQLGLLRGLVDRAGPVQLRGDLKKAHLAQPLRRLLEDPRTVHDVLPDLPADVDTAQARRLIVVHGARQARQVKKETAQ